MTLTPEPGANTPGLLPHQIEEAAQRLERYLAQRYSSVESAYQTRRLWLRFVSFQATRAAASLGEAAQAWLGAIPASRQALARSILKSAFGATACDWRAVVLKPYRRNELRLSAGVFRGDARAQVRAAVGGPRELAIVECLWVLRRAEVAALCWGDLDLDRGMITIRKGKGDKPSWTLLPPSTQAALAAWRRHVADAPPPFSPVDAAPVFPRQIGRGVKGVGGPYTPGGLGLLVRRILVRAGLWTKYGGAGAVSLGFKGPGLLSVDGDMPGVQHLALQVIRGEDLLDTRRLIGWSEWGYLGHGAILP